MAAATVLQQREAASGLARSHFAGDELRAVRALQERLWADGARWPAKWRELVVVAERDPRCDRTVLELVAREAYYAHDAWLLDAATRASRVVDSPTAALWSGLRSERLGEPSALKQLEEVEKSCRAAARPILVVDAVLGQAGALLTARRPEEALARARRASHMAATEALPLHELHAGLAVAIARREMGEVHLARRALALLSPLVPRALRGWLDLEGVLCGSGAMHAEPEAPVGSLAWSLARAAEGVEPEPRLDPHLAYSTRELAVLALGLLGCVEREDATGELGWSAGRGGAAPRGLGCFGAHAARMVAPVVVLCRPGRPPRRLLAAGLNRLPPLPTVDLSDAPQERTVTAVAALALANEPVDEAALFKKLYGCSYEPPLHRPVLNRLLSRARHVVAPFADLVRHESSVALNPKEAFAVWDPRCAPSLERRLLVALGSGRRSAAEMAAVLGCSRRAVQLILRSLQDEGVCRRVGTSRRVRYELVDTSLPFDRLEACAS